MATEAELVAQIAALEAGMSSEKRITKGDRTIENHNLGDIATQIASLRQQLAIVRGRRPRRLIYTMGAKGC